MTTEVLIINRNGVAIAADSAVTFHTGKIFNSANKLFMLAPSHQVGVLIYNNASFVNTSWELIIKLFRDHLIQNDLRFDYLKQYSEAFIKYIIEKSEMIVPDIDQEDNMHYLIDSLLRQEVFEFTQNKIKQYILENTKAVSENFVIQITIDQISKLHAIWSDFDNYLAEEMTDDFNCKLKEKYQSMFDQLYKHYFEALKLESEYKDQLWSIVEMMLTKKNLSTLFSGIVLTGYGTKDLYPSFTHFNIDGYICGRLKHWIVDEGNGNELAGVVAFAQKDIVNLFVQGIHVTAIDSLEKNLRTQLETLYDAHIVNESSKKEIDKTARLQFVDNEIQKLFNNLQKDLGKEYTNPIIETVRSLPKDELALMAETLVNSTSYMRRVSNTAETVGGPTDVAVISKKDGFIWIKRKHYFESQYNQHFFE